MPEPASHTDAQLGQFEKFFILEKYDNFKGIATGIATAEQVDRDKEILDYAKSKPFFESWSQSVHKDSGGKSFGNVRLQHDEKKPCGKLNSIEFNDDAKLIRVEALIVEPTAKDMLDKGVLSGFSIGGRYVEKSPESNGITRYVADPCEISVVDRPALPNAVFQSVKADGTTELRKFAKYEGAVEAPPVASKSNPPESFDAIRARVQGALEEKYRANKSDGDAEKKGNIWIKEIFLDSVVYSVNESGKGDGQVLESTFKAEGDKLNLSEPIEVYATYVPADKSVRYLVPDGEHLPFTDESGNISHRLMGAAWAALHGGYRGNKYEGADKSKALARLKRLYESEGMETPDAAKAVHEAVEILKSTDIESTNEEILGLLDHLEKTIMADEKDLTLDKAARHSAHQKISAAKAAITSHLAASKAHHDAMHAHLDGIAKVLGGGAESVDAGGKSEVVVEGRAAGAPQVPGGSDTADKADKFVLVGKDADGNEIYRKAETIKPPDAKEIAQQVVKTMLEIQSKSVEAIGDRSKAKPFVKAATKEADGAAAAGANDGVEKMTDDDWKAYSEGNQKAIAKAQRCTAQKWQPTPSRIMNREGERVGAAH